MTSMRRNDVASTSFRRHVPTRFLSNQCQIITFLILKYDIIENSRIELRGIVLTVQVGGLLGGPKGMLAPPLKLLGGAWPPCPPSPPPPPPPPPPPLPTPMITCAKLTGYTSTLECHIYKGHIQCDFLSIPKGDKIFKCGDGLLFEEIICSWWKIQEKWNWQICLPWKRAHSFKNLIVFITTVVIKGKMFP